MVYKILLSVSVYFACGIYSLSAMEAAASVDSPHDPHPAPGPDRSRRRIFRISDHSVLQELNKRPRLVRLLPENSSFSFEHVGEIRQWVLNDGAVGYTGQLMQAETVNRILNKILSRVSSRNKDWYYLDCVVWQGRGEGEPGSDESYDQWTIEWKNKKRVVSWQRISR